MRDGRLRHGLHEEFVLTLSSAHEDALYAVTGFVQRINDMLRLMSDCFHSRIIMKSKGIEICVHRQSVYHTPHG